MKAKKHWNRRVLSFLLALAMVVTQLGVWNVGKESVQAAEDSVIYSDDMENDADENWDVAWKTLEGVTVERSANQWAKNNVTKWWVFKSPVENQVTITRKIQVTSGSYIVSEEMFLEIYRLGKKTIRSPKNFFMVIGIILRQRRIL